MFRKQVGPVVLLLLLGLRAVAQTPSSDTQQSDSAATATQLPPATAAQADSAAAQALETPLPSKVRGQAPFNAQFAFAGETTFILQHLFAFPSPYVGPNSLLSRNETELTHTYTLYLGVRPTPRLEIYVNPEWALGNGISNGSGLAGYSNGDLIGQNSLRPEPYIARFFVRWRIPLRRRGAPKQPQAVAPATNVIGGNLPASRLVILAGKFAVSDHFDVNSYANNARLQFLNNAFINNLAYDKAAETRGYDLGLMLSWIEPGFALRLGSFAMPTTAGGPDLAFNFANEHSDQAELDVQPRLLRGRDASPMIVRLLAYRNVGTMGRYVDTLVAHSPDVALDIASVRQRGAVKYGFGLNFEQPLGDGGASGLFGRWGWNDGSTESFAYAEADRFLSLGGQVSGAHWRRPNDVVGVALAQSDLSAAHKAYLAAGGLGLSLGDGRLTYGPEQIIEGYYACQLSKALALMLDYQFINHPGYNQDRGPANLLSLRMHLAF
jgi:high affinity Mn2+ porin